MTTGKATLSDAAFDPGALQRAQEPGEPPRFDSTSTEDSLISEIADRYLGLVDKTLNQSMRLRIRMDLTACHLNGCELRLEALRDADDFELAHDVQGIDQFIDRQLGRLPQHIFRPRFAKTVENFDRQD